MGEEEYLEYIIKTAEEKYKRITKALPNMTRLERYLIKRELVHDQDISEAEAIRKEIDKWG